MKKERSQTKEALINYLIGLFVGGILGLAIGLFFEKVLGWKGMLKFMLLFFSTCGLGGGGLYDLVSRINPIIFIQGDKINE